jgi:GDP-L-fucose synthase
MGAGSVRILVTGGNGFLGRHVVRLLKDDEHQVSAPRSTDYDLRREGAVRAALADSEADVVVHLAAAVGGIGANVEHPGRFLYENALMGLQLMEHARKSGVEKFLTVGTACEYPADASLPLREENIWNGYPAPETAPYGLAKRLILAQGQAYREEYGFNAIHLIPTNLYGPGDDFTPERSHVIPALIARVSEAARKDQPEVRCWGTGTATREFLYVEDAAHAVALALRSYDRPEPVNIGTGAEHQIAWIAHKIAEFYGYKGKIIWDATGPEGVSRRWMDISRAKVFGFTAAMPLLDGLEATIEWYER